MTVESVPQTLLRDAFPQRPALDMALSHALLLRVAERARPPACASTSRRRPSPSASSTPTPPGFAAACEAARAHGYEPVIRLGGGHAAAYGPGCLIHEEIVPHDSMLEGLSERYVRETGARRRRCAGSARRSSPAQLEGEYCAGAHSLHAGGVKVAGISQRVIKGAALTSTVVLARRRPVAARGARRRLPRARDRLAAGDRRLARRRRRARPPLAAVAAALARRGAPARRGPGDDGPPARRASSRPQHRP